MYRHPRLIPVRQSAADRLEALFGQLAKDPSRLPLRFRGRLESHRTERVVGEYLAGMTDEFCDAQHALAASNPSGPLADW